VLRRFEDYVWPGNVRELHHAVARVIALGELDRTDLSRPRELGTSADPVEEVLRMDLPLSQARQRLVDHFERRYVERVVEKHGGSIAAAAAASGIALRYFQLIRARMKKSE
jgi:two-component system, NtrC family, response regulator HydG